jgi:hypothetical protein
MSSNLFEQLFIGSFDPFEATVKWVRIGTTFNQACADSLIESQKNLVKVLKTNMNAGLALSQTTQAIVSKHNLIKCLPGGGALQGEFHHIARGKLRLVRDSDTPEDFRRAV